MKYINQHIIYRTIIIALVMCLALPCSAKQDIKKVLNIPTFENVEKPNKTTTCQTLAEKSTQKTSLSFQKKMMKNNFFVIFLLVHNTRKLPNIKYKEKAFFSLVPIYILHEQYLI